MLRYIMIVTALALASSMATARADDGAWQGCLMLQSNPVYSQMNGADTDPIVACHVPEGKAFATAGEDSITTAVNVMYRYNPDWVERFCRRGVNRVTCEYRGRTFVAD